MQRADMRSKRSGAVSIAHNVSVGLLALTLACLHSSAYGQSADLVLCDRLAADPADPDKPKDVKGAHEIEASDVATAIKFCKLASAASPRAGIPAAPPISRPSTRAAAQRRSPSRPEPCWRKRRKRIRRKRSINSA